MDVDFLLIGQGLAGTVLSFQLVEAGYKILVIDKSGDNSSSKVAAGLYNPVTGRKMVKTWNADLFFGEIEPFYQRMENFLGSKFLYPKKIYRPFISIEEQNEWMGRSGEENYVGYIDSIKTTSFFPPVNDPYGGVMLQKSGYLDIKKLLDLYAEWLREMGALMEADFMEADLQLTGKGVFYRGVNARAIIFTNGLGAMQSKFFHWLPFHPVKGEILSLQQAFYPKEIINRGVFRITLPDKTIKVGSTYSRHDLISGPTKRGKLELLEKLQQLVSLPVERILHHQTGIRPATKDRKPFLGKHPDLGNVYIFNGLGAKGVSMAPYLSREMLNFLVLGQEPQKEVNINRFFKYI